MKIKIEKELDNYLIGKKLIEVGINLDEGIADLLKFQVKLLKDLVKNELPIDEIQKANTLLRNIIMALNITEEKIKVGILLCEKCDNSKYS